MPLRGWAGVVEVFDKLVAFPSLLTHPHLTIEVLLLREDHVRGEGPERLGRRRRDPGERRLIDVFDRVEFRGPGDFVRMLPAFPSDPFGTRELAALLGCSVSLAQRTAWFLRMVGILGAAGRRGRTPLHLRPDPRRARA